MKHWVLAAATLLLIQGVEAREHWGPPPACPQPKAEDCSKCPPSAAQKTMPVKREACARPCQKPCERKKPKPCPPICFERGFPTDPECTPPAFSESAAIDLQCGYDVFATVSFLYWQAIQGGMDLAIPGQGTISGTTLSAPHPSALGFSILKTDFEYKPGFQVGFGWSGIKDNWVLYAQYSWLHGHTFTSHTAPAPDVTTVNGVSLPQNGIWLPTSWVPTAYANTATTAISARWKYKIDLVDLQISRPFYSGTRFLVEPFFGVRGAWIRQNMTLTTPLLMDGDVTSPPGTSAQCRYNSRSSAVGFRVGADADWHLGYGLRLISDAAASLLFTNYDVRQSADSRDTAAGDPFPVKTKLNDFNALRPNVDLALGIGWGSYFGCRRFHWNIEATYDYIVFFEQNMMRYLADMTSELTGAAPANLYLHGLTLKTRFDF